MRNFEQGPPIYAPTGDYLSGAELDALTGEELEAVLALALDSMTEEMCDGDVIARYLDALDAGGIPDHLMFNNAANTGIQRCQVLCCLSPGGNPVGKGRPGFAGPSWAKNTNFYRKFLQFHEISSNPELIGCFYVSWVRSMLH